MIGREVAEAAAAVDAAQRALDAAPAVQADAVNRLAEAKRQDSVLVNKLVVPLDHRPVRKWLDEHAENANATGIELRPVGG